MEPLTIFALTVGFIGIFHLLSVGIERMGYGRMHRESAKGTRDDWYCFFQLSDLLGKQADNTVSRQTPVNNTDRIEQRRKQQANRPRLQA